MSVPTPSTDFTPIHALPYRPRPTHTLRSGLFPRTTKSRLFGFPIFFFALPFFAPSPALANAHNFSWDTGLSLGQFSHDSDDVERDYGIPDIEHSLFYFHIGGVFHIEDSPLSVLVEGRLGTGGEDDTSMEVNGFEATSTLDVQTIIGAGVRIEAGSQDPDSIYGFAAYNWDRVQFEIETEGTGPGGMTASDSFDDDVSGASAGVGLGYRFEEVAVEFSYQGIAGSDFGTVILGTIRGRAF